MLFQGPDADPNEPIAAKAIEEFSPDVVVAWREPGYQIGVKWQSESRRNTVRKWMVRGWRVVQTARQICETLDGLGPLLGFRANRAEHQPMVT